MLLPGFSIAFHAATLGRSRSSVVAYQRAARAAAQRNPSIRQAVSDAIAAIRPMHGLEMARVRRSTQLPFWSRLAILEFRKRGHSKIETAHLFSCSPGTVANIWQGNGQSYCVLSGDRRLSKSQRNPVGKWPIRTAGR